MLLNSVLCCIFISGICLIRPVDSRDIVSEGSELSLFEEQCPLQADGRQQCGQITYDKQECLIRGCCWDPHPKAECNHDVPWCFLAQRMIREECMIPDEGRFQCGYDGITEGECILHGCCWAPSPTESPSCFNKTVYRNDGTLRLVGTNDPWEGRVEIFHNGIWGTICGRWLKNSDARLVCRSLGYRNSGLARKQAYYGEGTGPIWLEDVECGDSYYTSNFNECKFGEWASQSKNCTHEEDFGVFCETENNTAETILYSEQGDVRLTYGAPGMVLGRLEVSIEGKWMSVCNRSVDEVAAGIICRSFGYSGSQKEAMYAALLYDYGSGNSRRVDDFKCNGDEDSFLDCLQDGWKSTYINDCTATGIKCYDASDGELRLVDGNEREGRVEIFHDGQWGTICDDWFRDEAADVICMSIGYRSGVFRNSTFFGPGSGRIWLDEVHCYGTEPSLHHCFAYPWGVNDCNHEEDVGVSCFD